MSKRKNNLFALGIIVIGFGVILAYSSVDNSLSYEDEKYIPLYLKDVLPLSEKPKYEDELQYIISVQRAVLAIAPGQDGLPVGQEREPMDLYVAKTGLCFDRSRVIEKILRYAGFETRHIFILSTKNSSAIKSLFSRGVSSHAVTEVLTRKGWLVVDANDPWVSINGNGLPVPIDEIQFSDLRMPARIYEEPFVYVYGLYSRHGKFYPPYNAIPDIEYSEFVQNLF